MWKKLSKNSCQYLRLFMKLSTVGKQQNIHQVISLAVMFVSQELQVCSQVGTFCLAGTKIPDYQKESIKHIICINCLGTVSPFYQLENGRNPSEIQVPRCQPRTNLSVDGTLWSAKFSLSLSVSLHSILKCLEIYSVVESH